MHHYYAPSKIEAIHQCDLLLVQFHYDTHHQIGHFPLILLKLGSKDNPKFRALYEAHQEPTCLKESSQREASCYGPGKLRFDPFSCPLSN